jgi:hypothetical protein
MMDINAGKTWQMQKEIKGRLEKVGLAREVSICVKAGGLGYCFLVFVACNYFY